MLRQPTGFDLGSMIAPDCLDQEQQHSPGRDEEEGPEEHSERKRVADSRDENSGAEHEQDEPR